MAQENVKTNKDTANLKTKLASPVPPLNDTTTPSTTATMDTTQQNNTSPEAKNESMLNGALTPQAKGAPVDAKPNAPPTQPPPELRHITENFHPLSRLFARTAQESYNGLDDLLTELAELSETSHQNGASNNDGNGLASAASTRMRTRWLQFTHDQRQRFMQLLVILQWSERAADVSKLIDVFVWEEKNIYHHANAHDSFGQVKRGASVARIPPPGFDTALRVLRSEQHTTFSDFGALPKKPLGPKKALETLQNLNIALKSRLVLYEDLPPYLNDYRIANGRVTFTIPDVFEVDLAIVDEDPKSQFWFQDARILFTSTPELSLTQFGSGVEQRVNAALRTHGLAGCIEVLHEYALTLRISILKQQFFGNRSPWSERLKIEQPNRSLVIQYWFDMPGKKSWIQIGVRKGQPAKFIHWQGYWPSRLFLKWTRHGEHVQDFSFPAKLIQASAHTILQSTVVQHIASSLSELRHSLTAYNKNRASVLPNSVAKSKSHSSSHVLRLPCRWRKHCSIYIEPLSGKFALQPATLVSAQFERELNSALNPDKQGANIIERWLATETRNRIEERAQRSKWIIRAPPGTHRESVKKTFGNGSTELLFMQKSHWEKCAWHVVVASSPEAESFWVVRLVREDRVFEVREKERLNSTSFGSVLESGSEISFSRLEDEAVSTISRCVWQRRLAALGARPSDHKMLQNGPGDALCLSFDANFILRRAKTLDKKLHIIVGPKIAVANFGYVHGLAKAKRVSLVATGILQKAFVNMGFLDPLKKHGISFNHQGAFSLKVQSLLGSPDAIDGLLRQLGHIERVCSLLHALHENRLECEIPQLNRVIFRLPNREDRVTVAFDDTGVLRLGRAEPATSPVNRIKDVINGTLKSIFASFDELFRLLIKMLVLILPSLQAFEAVEAADPKVSRARLTVHDWRWYTMFYSQVGMAVNYVLTCHYGKPCWCITIQPSMHTQKIPEMTRSFVNSFAGLARQRGDGWHGQSSGIVATTNAIADMISRIDAMVSPPQNAVGNQIIVLDP